jgi:hypothetical protein
MHESIFVSPELALQPDFGALPTDYKGDKFGLLPAETDGDAFVMSVHHPLTKVKETDQEVFVRYVGPAITAAGLPAAVDTLTAEPVVTSGEGISKLQLRDPLMAMGADVRKVKKVAAKHPGGLQGVLEDDIALAEGTTLQGFIEDLTLPERHFVYRQFHEGTMVEGAMVVASAREGHGVHTVRGALYNAVSPLNSISIEPFDAQNLAVDYYSEALGLFVNDNGIIVQGMFPGSKIVVDYPTAVLLPSDDGHLYAWRGRLRIVALAGNLSGPPTTGDFGQLGKEHFSATFWIDAEEGTWLGSSVTGGHEVAATGRSFRNDPGTGPWNGGNPTTESIGFRVDAAAGGKYTLKLAGVHNQVDRGANGISTSGSGAEVSISASNNGSSSSFANFDQASINDSAGRRAICQTDANHNPAFTEVDLAASIQRFHTRALGAGVIDNDTIKFPRSPWSPTCNDPNADAPGSPCNARAGMTFGYGPCFANAACPNCTGSGCNHVLNFVHDHTVTAHEMAHNIAWQQFCQRAGCGPDCTGTCGTAPIWHDVADGWAATYEGTPCVGGWTIKNSGGVDQSLYCNPNHDEGGWLPRLLNGADKFPDHRDLDGNGVNDNTDEYANSQIASYAVWEIRKGMESRCPPSGIAAFERRFMQALANMTYSYTAPSGSDRHLEQGLRDLLRAMVAQWASATNTGTYENGSPSTNKVTAGFARAGIFLQGHEAVIDVEDNDTDDRDVDWLDRDDAPPTFQVWTGREYTFDSSGKAVAPGVLPMCGTSFRVHVSTSPTFAAGSQTFVSDWVDAVECKGSYTLTAGEWNAVRGTTGGAAVKLYYRAETFSDPFPALVSPQYRMSTQPGNGAFSVPAPYAVINDTGTAGGCSATSGGAAGLWSVLLLTVLGVRRRVGRQRR